MQRKSIFWYKFTALLLVLALILPVLAACDDDDDDKTTTVPEATTQTPATTTQPPATTTQPPMTPEEPQPFSIVVLPDTQLYSKSYPETFFAQTEWIVDQKEVLNIALVVHEGDLIDTYGSREEFDVADEAMGLLDGVVPYAVAIGNHDYTACPNMHYQPDKPITGREAPLFDEYFGPQRFEQYPWYGGHFEEGNENAYYLVDAEGIEFLIICLEFGPRDEVLEWANEIVSQYEDRQVIVVTHAYTSGDDSWIADDDLLNGITVSGCAHADGNNAKAMWDKFVSKHKNIFLVLSGHVLAAGGAGRFESVGDNGNTVYQILANYQNQRNGGDGWLRIMKFVPAEDKIVVTTFSPTLNEYLSDPEHEFEIQYSH